MFVCLRRPYVGGRWSGPAAARLLPRPARVRDRAQPRLDAQSHPHQDLSAAAAARPDQRRTDRRHHEPQSRRSARSLTGSFLRALERCNPWPHVANRHISISQPAVIIMTSFATELSTPSVTDERTYVTHGHLTAFNV